MACGCKGNKTRTIQRTVGVASSETSNGAAQTQTTTRYAYFIVDADTGECVVSDGDTCIQYTRNQAIAEYNGPNNDRYKTDGAVIRLLAINL